MNDFKICILPASLYLSSLDGKLFLSMNDSFDFYHRILDHLIDFLGCQLRNISETHKSTCLPLDSSLK